MAQCFNTRQGGLPVVHCESCPVGVVSTRSVTGGCPFVTRTRSKGELLYLEDEVAAYCWFVKRGTVALFRKDKLEQGFGRIRALRFPGSFIGLEALVSPHYLDSARAETNVTLCGTSLQDIDAWLGVKEAPARTALELTLLANCGDAPRCAARDGNAVQRVASWLCDEGPREATFVLPRQTVANLLGMRPETLSRALAELARRGAVSVTRARIRITNVAVLQNATWKAKNTCTEE